LSPPVVVRHTASFTEAAPHASSEVPVAASIVHRGVAEEPAIGCAVR
jgi:hypothetical protein